MKYNWTDKVPFTFGIVCIILVLLNGFIFKKKWLNWIMVVGVVGLTLMYLFW